MATNRKPDRYVTLSFTDDVPLLPATVKKMLDEIPTFSDIVEMSITADPGGPFPTRHVAIYYSTSMPWEAK